jgi:multidrug transporter EmrE-like cation transporter
MMAAGLAIMKSRAPALPTAHGSSAAKAVLCWISDLPWVAALIIQAAGYALYFAALECAPVSLVAVVMQGGIAVFVLIAVVFLRERANYLEASGIVGIILAMILLGLSLDGMPVSSQLNSRGLWMVSTVTLAVTGAVCSARRLRANGLAEAIASGMAFGLSTLYAKALADMVAMPAGSVKASGLLASPWLYLTMLANIGGLVLLQNSFNRARGLIAMPLSSAISNLVPIVGGLMIFGEHLPRDLLPAVFRTGAFVLTIGGSVLLAGGDETAHRNYSLHPPSSLTDSGWGCGEAN